MCGSGRPQTNTSPPPTHATAMTPPREWATDTQHQATQLQHHHPLNLQINAFPPPAKEGRPAYRPTHQQPALHINRQTCPLGGVQRPQTSNSVSILVVISPVRKTAASTRTPRVDAVLVEDAAYMLMSSVPRLSLERGSAARRRNYGTKKQAASSSKRTTRLSLRASPVLRVPHKFLTSKRPRRVTPNRRCSVQRGGKRSKQKKKIPERRKMIGRAFLRRPTPGGREWLYYFIRRGAWAFLSPQPIQDHAINPLRPGRPSQLKKRKNDDTTVVASEGAFKYRSETRQSYCPFSVRAPIPAHPLA